MIMVLAFFISHALTIIEDEIVQEMTSNPSLEDSLVCIFSLATIGVFIFIMPAIAGSIVSGNPNINIANSASGAAKKVAQSAAKVAGTAAKLIIK